jgi:hypothetical protein
LYIFAVVLFWVKLEDRLQIFFKILALIVYRGRLDSINNDQRNFLNEWLNNNISTNLTMEIKKDLSSRTGLTVDQIKRLVKHQRTKFYFQESYKNYFA